MKLVNKTTKEEVKIGDAVTTFRGEKAILKHFDRRKVYCSLQGEERQNQWYPAVIGCEIVDQ